MAVQKGIWENSLEYAAISDVGMRRETNQDAHKELCAADLAAWRQHGHIFLVADGMGAHAAGELASKLAVDGISHLYFKYSHLGPFAAVSRAFHETNTEVHRRGQANLDFNNMGTTASVLVLAASGAYIGHIGDSRIYRCRGGHLEQWTFDHSIVWELRRMGKLPKDPAEAQAIPKNVITRSIGPFPYIEPELQGPIPLELGDVFLLCSDGLTARVTDEELAVVLSRLPPAVAAQLLVDIANLRGGPDNITVVIGKVVGDSLVTDLDQPESDCPPPAASERRGLPIPWLAASVLALGSLTLLIVDQQLAALVAAAFALLSAVWGFAQRTGLLHSGARTRRHAQGEGPHERVDVPPAPECARILAGIAAQVREFARVGGWEEDIPSLDEMHELARNSEARQDWNQAMREYAGLIRELAERLRIHHMRRTSGTATNL